MNKKQMEDEITKAMITWEKDYMGRGPTEAKTDILRNMVIVYLRGILSPAERHLAINKKGTELVKQLRHQLVEQSRAEFDSIIKRITSTNIISMHTDISVKMGDRIFVFIIDREL
jgi:uncharacterized protein YbcI